VDWSHEDAAYRELSEQTDSKILYLVLDGLGDLAGADGFTPLEGARTPNLDRLALEGASGLFDPVAPAITPGSGPGHLGLFGYDPLEHFVGRGVLAALGVGFPLGDEDVAARFNYCTLDGEGRVVDRRAGRISSEENRRVTELLQAGLDPGEDGVEVMLRTVSEHRGLLVLRGDGLGAKVSDTDPQVVGVAPLAPRGEDDAARRTAAVVERLVEQARRLLSGEPRVNGILLRGFDSRPPMPGLSQRFRLRPACIAQYPMYRGLAHLVGMDMVDPPESLQDMVTTLAGAWADHDFFFCHVKYTDKAGEDGDFQRKLEVIEEVDRLLPQMLELGPDVVVVTADHSTPASMKMHSWHPVPTLLWAPGTVRVDGVAQFGETACVGGGLGRHRLRYLLPLALAHAGKLKKFGA